MAENFFTDNSDLQFRLEQLDLSQVVDILEDGYRYQDLYPAAIIGTRRTTIASCSPR